MEAKYQATTATPVVVAGLRGRSCRPHRRRSHVVFALSVSSFDLGPEHCKVRDRSKLCLAPIYLVFPIGLDLSTNIYTARPSLRICTRFVDVIATNKCPSMNYVSTLQSIVHHCKASVPIQPHKPIVDANSCKPCCQAHSPATPCCKAQAPRFSYTTVVGTLRSHKASYAMFLPPMRPLSRPNGHQKSGQNCTSTITVCNFLALLARSEQEKTGDQPHPGCQSDLRF